MKSSVYFWLEIWVNTRESVFQHWNVITSGINMKTISCIFFKSALGNDRAVYDQKKKPIYKLHD